MIVHWRQAEGRSMDGVKYLSTSDLVVGAGPCTTFAEYTVVAEVDVPKYLRITALEMYFPYLAVHFPPVTAQ